MALLCARPTGLSHIKMYQDVIVNYNLNEKLKIL